QSTNSGISISGSPTTQPGPVNKLFGLKSPVENGGETSIAAARLFPSNIEWCIISSHRSSSGEMMAKEAPAESEMLKGTLDMMILRTLVVGDAHGHTIAKIIERTSEDVLEVEQGSLYPALHRLEDRRWVASYWGASENNRKAKFYRLTAEGRKQLVRERNRWRKMTRAIG